VAPTSWSAWSDLRSLEGLWVSKKKSKIEREKEKVRERKRQRKKERERK
jgi:hypothetical protein